MKQLKNEERRSLALVSLVFFFLVLGIAVSAYVSYTNYERQYRSQVDNQLLAIANLKVSGILNWRNERLGDAEFLHRNSAFAALVQDYFKDPTDPQSKEMLQEWLNSIYTAYEYDRVFLLDTSGVERLAAPDTLETPPSHLVNDVTAVLQSDQVTFIDFHRDEDQSEIHLALLIPIYEEKDILKPLGVVVLRINPEITLYPYLKQWPASTETAETLLVRLDGDAVLFLNPARFQPDSALKLRIPVTNTDVLAVKVALGHTGVVEGQDYRGVETIGAVLPVPGTSWFLVARIDKSEIYAPLRARLWQTILFFGILTAASGVILLFLWRQQRMRYYRAQAETAESLRESEEKFKYFFEHSTVGKSITQINGGMQVNKALCNLLGYSPQEMQDKKWQEITHPDDIELTQREIDSLLSGEKESARFVKRFIHKNGAVVWVDLGSTLRRDGQHKPLYLMSAVIDITERKRTENIVEARLRLVDFSAHHSLEELLTKTLDEVCAITNSPIGFYHFVEPDQKTLSLQAWSTRTMQEYCKAEGKGLHYDVEKAGVWVDCIHARQPVIHNDYDSLSHRRGLPEGHAALRRELVVPVFRDDLIVAILGVGNKAQNYTETDVETVSYFADVTWEIVRRKQAEQQLERYTEKLEEMVDERTYELKNAQEKLVRQERLATLGQLAGSIGHELRNPLGVISNAIYFLKAAQPDADDRIKEYLDIIEKETHTSDKIITDLLDFTRIKSVDRKSVSVTELIRQTLERYPAPPSVDVTLEIAPDLPNVYADPRHVIQVLGNLTVNACQAMTNGGKLTLSATAQGDMITFAIKDTGMGIPPDHMKKLFEPLFTTKIKGIGLGLAVSRKLAEASGGRIEVQSEPEKGSTFTLFLPIYKE